MKKFAQIFGNVYKDSIQLMVISRTIEKQPGIKEAVAMVSSPGNMEMLKSRGLWIDSMGSATPSDIVLYMVGESDDALKKAAVVAEREIVGGGSAASSDEGGAQKRVPTTLAEGVATFGQPAPNLAVISVPGPSATGEGLKALGAGLHVFMFSNNVSIEDEAELKRVAAEKKLFVMGPDCGTAFLDGTPMAFCNQLRRGDVGLVGASGTGLQQVSSLIHQFGKGVSQMIGIGGHDLKDEVGGLMMLQGLEVLEKDPATNTIVLISKPPSQHVQDKILDAVKKVKKRVVIHFVGSRVNHALGADTLEDAALLAVGLEPRSAHAPAEGKQVRKIYGLFSGGTFQAEAKSMLKGVSDISLIDLGDDEYTKGKPHPMIDYSTRLEFIKKTAVADPKGIILLDVVLGHGSNEDPASQLVPVLTDVKKNHPGVTVVAHVCGTSEDPQGFDKTVERLQSLVLLTATNAAMVRTARDIAFGRQPDKPYVIKPVGGKPPATVSKVFGGIRAINVGVESFANNIRNTGATVLHLNWKPPAGGDRATGLMAAEMWPGTATGEVVARANATALDKVRTSSPVLVGVETARNVIPFFANNKKALMHAGPPITYDKMCGPMKGAVIGSIIFEGWAKTDKEADALASSGEIAFAPCHEHGAVGPMAGLTGPSSPVWIVENPQHGNKAFCNFNEGLGKVLRFGAYDENVQKRLRWMRDVLSPTLQKALTGTKIDLLAIVARALQMGDECHNRNAAASSLFFRELTPLIIKQNNAQEVLQFINSNDHFFLNLSMAACKASLDAAANVPGSTFVTVMARNGVEFGVQLSGTGKTWFTAASPIVDGLLFPGYSKADANPDMGDSSITETFGIGGASMAASPAITGFVGGNAASALRTTKEVYPIYMAKHPRIPIPALDNSGSPLGLDALRILEYGIAPVINTGIAHKQAGVGQIGAGVCRAPFAPFAAGVRNVHASLGAKNVFKFAARALKK